MVADCAAGTAIAQAAPSSIAPLSQMRIAKPPFVLPERSD